MEWKLVLGGSVGEQLSDPVLLQIELLVYSLHHSVEQQVVGEGHLCVQVVHLLDHLK